MDLLWGPRPPSLCGCVKGLSQPKGGCLLSPLSATLDPKQTPPSSLEVGPGEASAPVEPRGGGGRRRFADVAATEGGNTLSRANENIIIFFWLQRGANLIGCDRKASVEFTQQRKHLKGLGRGGAAECGRPPRSCV